MNAVGWIFRFGGTFRIYNWRKLSQDAEERGLPAFQSDGEAILPAYQTAGEWSLGEGALECGEEACCGAGLGP